MIQGQDYLVFILDNQQRFYYTDQYGIVQLSANPKPVRVTPDGWQEISILKERNKKYWGMDRTFTIPLKWVEDGAKILKTLYYGSGPQAACSILIVEQYLFIDGSYYDFRYKLFYKGEPDLTTFTHEGAVVTANCIEGGLSKLVKAYENTTYQIPCEEKTVNHDGIYLEQSGNFFIIPGVDVQRRQFVGSTATNVNNIFLPVALAGVDGLSTGVDFQAVMQQVAPGSFTDRIASTSWLAKNTDTKDLSFNIVGNIAFTCTNNDGNSGFRMRFLRSTMTLSEQDTLKLHPDTFALTVGQSYQFVINMTVTLKPNETLLLEGIFVGGVGGASTTILQFKDTGLMTIAFSNRFRATQVKAISLNLLFQTIIQKMTNGVYGFKSSILPKSNVYVTCGDALRGLPEAVIKTSLSDAFDAVTLIPGIGPIGMGIENEVLVLEPLSYLLTGTPIDLGEVNEFKVTVAADLLYNQIKVGYGSSNDGDLNGKDKFHTTLEFTTESLRSPKLLSLVSPWKADPIEMEDNRINLQGKTTTDDSSDNDIYLLATDGAGNLDRSLNSGAIGIIDPAGMYNISLSPKRILLSWGAFLRAILRGQDSTWIKYQSSDKNPRLVAAGVQESADVLVGTLPDGLFIAELHDFECPVPLDYVLGANRFTYTYDGVTMTGIAFRSGVQPGKVHTFQCLADSGNVLMKQIDIDG